MVQRELWSDEEGFLLLSTDARLIFLWAFTGGKATMCGLYPASLREVASALEQPDPDRWKEHLEPRVRGALEELARKPMVLYDEGWEVLWVVNRALHANRSPKVRTGMRREFRECPPSPLKEAFRTRYGGMLDLTNERQEKAT